MRDAPDRPSVSTYMIEYASPAGRSVPPAWLAPRRASRWARGRCIEPDGRGQPAPPSDVLPEYASGHRGLPASRRARASPRLNLFAPDRRGPYGSLYRRGEPAVGRDVRQRYALPAGRLPATIFQPVWPRLSVVAIGNRVLL